MLSKIVQNNFLKKSGVMNRVAASQFSTWSSLESAPPDPILGLNEAFKKD